MARMGFTFNGIHCEDLGVRVKEVSKSILPSIENQSTDIKYGGWHTGIRVTPREITISIYIDGLNFYSYEEKVRAVADWLFTETPQRLFLDEEPDIYYEAIIEGDTDIEQVLWYGEAEITFICFNPFAVSTRQTIISGAGNKKTEITYQGNAKCFPIVELIFQGEAVKPWIAINDRQLGIQGTHELGGIFTIDCDTANITANGLPALTLLDLTSEYPYLTKGKNIIDTNADKWNLKYYARYL